MKFPITTPPRPVTTNRRVAVAARRILLPPPIMPAVLTRLASILRLAPPKGSFCQNADVNSANAKAAAPAARIGPPSNCLSLHYTTWKSLDRSETTLFNIAIGVASAPVPPVGSQYSAPWFGPALSKMK